MLSIIGLGLKDAQSVSVAGLERIKAADVLYLEVYTSILTDATVADLEAFYDKKIIQADRNMVEVQAEATILKDAKEKNVCFLVIGDPFSATTHLDLVTRAQEDKIPVEVIPNTSVLTAIGQVGLELYKYGKTTSIPFDNANVKTPYDVYLKNQEMGLHTLFLLDLRPEEDRFMSCKEASAYLIAQGLPKDTQVVCCGGLGGSKQTIIVCAASDVPEIEARPACLIIAGKLHFMEEEALDRF